MKPRMMNFVDIKIQQFNHGDTPWDDDFNEPLPNRSYDGLVTLKGQINLGNKENARQEMSSTGDETRTFGHCVFRKSDLDEAVPPVVLAKGDRVTEVAGVAVDYELTEIRPESPLRGKFLLIYAEFTQPLEKRASL